VKRYEQDAQTHVSLPISSINNKSLKNEYIARNTTHLVITHGVGSKDNFQSFLSMLNCIPSIILDLNEGLIFLTCDFSKGLSNATAFIQI
jgi:hypothetical protein